MGAALAGIDLKKKNLPTRLIIEMGVFLFFNAFALFKQCPPLSSLFLYSVLA